MIFFLLLIIALTEQNTQQIIPIYINEELPLSTILFTTPNEIIYRLFDSGRNQNSFISYNTTDRQIILIHPLDREKLCSEHICSCLQCQLVIELIEWQSPYRIVKLILHLEDINDHSPRFSSNEYRLNLMENIPIGYEIPLESAHDDDLDENGRISYEYDNSTNSPFQLIKKSNGQVIFKVMKSIDREEQDFYQYRLIAFDHGQPRRESSTNIFITIDDMNDNSVKLSQTYLHLHLSENTPIGTELTSINATDDDIGMNGKIHYSLNHVYPMEYFHIDEFTGILILINSLDYELEQSYHLTIQVRDLGENSLAQFVSIDMTIIDENDNHPQAFVTFVQPLYNNSIISLVENTPIGQILAHISISDRDSGLNGQVSTEIHQGNEFIGMKIIDERAFLLILTRSIDREDQDIEENKLVLFIHDHGNPSKSIQLEYPIEIIDINDSPPRFAHECHREFSPGENQSIDEPFLRIQAIDDDRYENGRISYLILPPYDETFSINDQGEIYHLGELNQSFYHLQILAQDHGHTIRLNTTYDCFISMNNQTKIYSSKNYSLIITLGIVLILLIGITLGFVVYKLCIYPRRYFQPNKTYHLYVSIPRQSLHVDEQLSEQMFVASRTVSTQISRPGSISTCTTSNSMFMQLVEEEKLIA